MRRKMKSWFSEMWESVEALLVCTLVEEFDEKFSGKSSAM